MGAAFINSIQTFNTSSSVDTTGATLLVGTVIGNATTALTDNKSNTWNSLTQHGATAPFIQIYYAFNPTVGTGHTFTNHAGSSSYIAVAFFSGTLLTSSVFDTGTDSGADSGAGTSTTIQPGSITPSKTGDVIVSTVADGGAASITYSVGSGFTVAQSQTTFDPIWYFAYLIDSSSSAINPTWTRSAATSHLKSNIAAFIPSGFQPDEDFWQNAVPPDPPFNTITVF